LPSYALLVDVLRGWLETRRHVGVLHVGVGDLELVESLYGWQVFDGIVARVGASLRDAVGVELPADALLAISGIGGDRFVVFVPDPSAAGDLATLAAAVGRRLDDVVHDETLAGLSPSLTVRVGHALLSDNPFFRFERRVHAAVEAARALEGRRTSGRLTSSEGDLRRLIDDAAIATHLQPVIDLETGAILGYEALARGPAGGGLEAPAALFAIAERAGLARELDRLCRARALGVLQALPADGKLFVNTLIASLDDPDWRDGTVAALLRAAGRSAADLVVDISERGADAAPEAVAAACERLRDLGFGLALDDVGTGYATLATLERVRPDYLKMDLSLVRGVHESFIKQDLLASVVRIGRRIGAPVIAEGIESARETACVRAAGARYGQGFLYARPAPAVPGS
jgi:EAL domain-containing protein (putative c-di-GMP-specific phosphodiesterase class I)